MMIDKDPFCVWNILGISDIEKRVTPYDEYADIDDTEDTIVRFTVSEKF